MTCLTKRVSVKSFPFGVNCLVRDSETELQNRVRGLQFSLACSDDVLCAGAY
jgi:hypothetical protein